MSLSAENRIAIIKLLIEKSKRNFEQAVHNVDMGYWDLVANRLYYSVFHAVNALMVNDGIKTGTHKGTAAMFGKHYVLTGRFDRNDGILYSRLQTMREKADYQNVFCITEEEGQALVNNTETLNRKIYEFLEGYLSN
ncbi:MAG: HEPN domain-containing protein [Bacteroides sp.]|nr:HEPN domain-containing protein [Bacteroides sp.]